MRVIVDGLSATALSGRHVLLGHLAQLARFEPDRHEFFVLYHPANSELRRESSPNVHWIKIPTGVQTWKHRTLWELFSFRKLLRDTRADLVFTPSGTIKPGCPLPQVSLAQNPWCLLPSLHCGSRERFKAFIQRRAYRYAVEHSALMAYNSEFMRQAYRKNAVGIKERESLIVYHGLDDETHAAAADLRKQVAKSSLRLLTVSDMAPWKNIETLVDVLHLLRQRGLQVTWQIVGPWEPKYEQFIRQRIDARGLASHVTITGCVSRAELYRQYAEATVFCLLSHCESFGIPALEAQLFGTPVVISKCSAMPEICGAGAVSLPPDDPHLAADSLAALFESPSQRNHLAGAAVENASRFRWSECSLPLTRMFEFGRTQEGVSCG